MKIVVASKNPVKLQAVQDGFRCYYQNIQMDIVPVEVTSGVSSQPLGNDEIINGALNRIKNAQNEVPDADFWVGIEGGVEWFEKAMYANAWVVIQDNNGRISKGKTSMFQLPDKVVQLIKVGKELGEADDIVFGMQNTKQKMGAVGILTNGKITRASYYTEAVKLALIPFINAKYYD